MKKLLSTAAIDWKPLMTIAPGDAKGGFRWLSGEPWHTALEIFSKFRYFPVPPLRASAPL